MEFSVSSNELSRHLNALIGPIGPSPSMPILEDFLFVLSGDELTITASDLETTITSVVSVSSEDNGVFSSPAKMMLDTVKRLKDQPITISVNPDNRQVTITSAYGKYSMSGHDPEDYPVIDKPEDIDTLELPSDILLNAIGNTTFAVSTDEMRKSMMGVYFQIDFNKIVFVATDAHKLVRYTYKQLTSDVTTSFILSKKSLLQLKSILQPEEMITLEFDKKHATFTVGATTLNCVMMEGKYPDYNNVIPTENNNVLRINKAALNQSLGRLAIYANKTTNQTILNITEHSLTLTSQDVDFANEATEQLECEYSGEDLFIAFNAKFLLEILNILDDDTIVIKIDDTNRPALLFPESQKEDEDLLTLIMPVMLGY